MRKVKDSKNSVAFADSQARVGEALKAPTTPPPSREDLEYAQAVRMSGVRPGEVKRQAKRQQARQP